MLRLYATHGIKWVTSIHGGDTSTSNSFLFDARGDLVPKRYPGGNVTPVIKGYRAASFIHCSRSLDGLGKVDDIDRSVHDNWDIERTRTQRPTQR